VYFNDDISQDRVNTRYVQFVSFHQKEISPPPSSAAGSSSAGHTGTHQKVADVVVNGDFLILILACCNLPVQEIQ
jgi:hypothetical protein